MGAVAAAFAPGSPSTTRASNGAADSIGAGSPADSYQLTSSSYNALPASDSQQIHALCGGSYHVDGV